MLLFYIFYQLNYYTAHLICIHTGHLSKHGKLSFEKGKEMCDAKPNVLIVFYIHVSYIIVKTNMREQLCLNVIKNL